MADAHRHPPSRLRDGAAEDALRLLRETPERFDFFQALRLLEASYRDHPALGRGKRANAEPVRLSQPPHLAFPPSQIADFDESDRSRPPRLSTYVVGLFGPNGPLPLHLTVHARDRQRQFGDSSFARFCDIFQHRMLALYYRAWADASPTVAQDRPEEDRFAVYLGALCGLASPALRERHSVPDRFALFGAGLLAMQTRPPEAVARLLEAFFRVRIRVEEFAGAWLEIPIEQRSRVGRAQLGVDAVIGISSFQRHQRFRVHVGSMRLHTFRSFLPDGAAWPRFVALVRLAVGVEYDWEARLILRRDEVPEARLDGTSRLGWTSWLHHQARRNHAGDLVLEGR